MHFAMSGKIARKRKKKKLISGNGKTWEFFIQISFPRFFEILLPKDSSTKLIKKCDPLNKIACVMLLCNSWIQGKFIRHQKPKNKTLYSTIICKSFITLKSTLWRRPLKLLSKAIKTSLSVAENWFFTLFIWSILELVVMNFVALCSTFGDNQETVYSNCWWFGMLDRITFLPPQSRYYIRSFLYARLQ